MKAEIISVGTELLLGDIVNTNAQYLSKRLAEMGIFVYHQTVVGDNPQRIKDAFASAFARCDMVITTGGLGPTKDDLTKEMAAEYFNQSLVLHEESLKHIKEYFAKINKEMSESNKKQAFFPVGAVVFKNDMGTAPGCALEHDNKIIILLPGPPREMKPMFENEVVPYLCRFREGVLVSKVLRMTGIGESTMAEQLDDIIKSQTNPTVAPYAKENDVTVRITARANDTSEAEKLILPVEKAIKERLGEHIYGEGDTSLEEVVVKLLKARNLTVALAESCTGGLISAKLVNCPGVSGVFKEGAVTYSNESKIKRLYIQEESLKEFGAVSEKVAAEMARGIAVSAGTDIGLSTTGVAGPAGGTP